MTVLKQENYSLSSGGAYYRTHSIDTPEALDDLLASPEAWAAVSRFVKVGDHVQLGTGPANARVFALGIVAAKPVINNETGNGVTLALIGRSDAPVAAPAKRKAA